LARQELEESREALRRDGRRKSEFLSTLAHELRNPLAPMANSLELLKCFDGDSVTTKARDVIQRQLSYMVRLVDDLLDISRITRDRLELRTERVELASAIQESVEGCRPLFDKCRHQLMTEFPPEPIYLCADPVRLVQVFQNLLNNAGKYTEAGGTVSVAVEREGDTAVVSVRDTGIGIPADRLDEVFEMFSRVNSGGIRMQGGLGIGLALVKRLVEMHNGTVEARSEGLGKGAEFVVRLPALNEDHGATQQPQVKSAANESAVHSLEYRILVVDDNEDSAESMGELLQLSGNTVQSARDGLEALEAVARFEPHVVLLDIGLPKMDGYEVCQAIRRNQSKRRPFVVALTGWGQDNDRRKSLEAGFDHHLVKPVSFDVLMQLLASLSIDENAPMPLGT
jgi:CheY-like chemotaxis protein